MTNFQTQLDNLINGNRSEFFSYVSSLEFAELMYFIRFVTRFDADHNTDHMNELTKLAILRS